MSADTTVGLPASGASLGARRFFARAVYVYFSRPLLFLLPALLVTFLGTYMAVSRANQYESAGVLSVSTTTFLDQISERANDFSFESPAATVGRQFNELMFTDGFAASVADAAGLREARLAGALTLGTLRQNVFATTRGDNLVRISATAEDPQLAKRLADAAIATYKNHIIGLEVQGSDVAESFYDQQLDAYALEVDAAKDALENYLQTHPAPVDASIARDPAEQLAIERLNASLARAQTRMDQAFDLREASRLATLQSSANVGERLRVLDAPSVPTLPTSGKRTMALMIAAFMILGGMLSLGAVVLATVLDRSIHGAADLTRLGVPVLAVVPRTKEASVETNLRSMPQRDQQVVPIRSAG